MALTTSNLHPLAVLGPAPHAAGSLQGFCTTTYSNLIALLGEPHVHRGDKTTVEWAFRCHNGTVFTVYDWKEIATPTGPYPWHIGGHGDPLTAFSRYTGLETTPMRLWPVTS